MPRGFFGRSVFLYVFSLPVASDGLLRESFKDWNPWGFHTVCRRCFRGHREEKHLLPRLPALPTRGVDYR